MHDTELLLGLLAAIPFLSIVARFIGVPYPIALVIGALALGAIPGVPEVTLDPDLVLVIFLPPLLYVAAFFANLRELRRDLRAISMLAIGLVIFTTCAVAVVAKLLIDDLPWAAAFALGAIVSPTDPTAATSIARRLGTPRRLVAVIEGESLVNDATALVLYRLAVGAAIGGSFSLLDAGLRFVGGVLGGIAVGLLVGWVIARLRRPLNDPPVEITISLFTAYVAYLPAEELGLSGVLAAVTAGIYLGWKAPEISSAEMRMQGAAVWQFIVFLLNAVLFMLIGLQLPSILDGLDGFGTLQLAGYAAAVCAVVVGARLVWLFTTPYVIRALDRRPAQVERRVGAPERLVSAWAGMRGAVSLAAALALPLETDAGAPFPERDLLIFLAYCVILFTLLVQGLTLPLLIRRLGVRDDGTEEAREEQLARMEAAQSALGRLAELEAEDWVRADTAQRVGDLYRYRHRRFSAQRDGEEDLEDRSDAYKRLMRELIESQHDTVVAMRNRGDISNDVMHRVQHDLDLEETRLQD